MRCIHFSGIGIVRSTGTAVTLFFGEPSMMRSEYVRYTSVLRFLSTMRTTRSFLNSVTAVAVDRATVIPVK